MQTLKHQGIGGLAQLGEHLLCKQGVVGSIPSSSTNHQCTAFFKKSGLHWRLSQSVNHLRHGALDDAVVL
jgi:hypothetical protein